jgi:hypothetical protein
VDIIAIIKAVFKNEAFLIILGAVIGGTFTLKGSKIQVKAQMDALEQQKRTESNKTFRVIHKFIRKEIQSNYDLFIKANASLPLDLVEGYEFEEFTEHYRSYSINYGHGFKTDHYDQFKYDIVYMDNNFADELIDYYELFDLVSKVDYREFTEEQYYFFKETLLKLQFFLIADYDHWGALGS